METLGSLTRRRLLRSGLIQMGGLALPALARAGERPKSGGPSGRARARACI
jgi:hypothetical protein